jgi:aspartyl protease family protein
MMMPLRWLGLVLASLLAGDMSAQEVMLLGVFPDRVLVEWDGQRRVLVAGQEAPGGVRLLSTDTGARQAWLEIDGERLRLGPVLRIGNRADVPGQGPSEARIFPDSTGRWIGTGSINGHAVSFLVDRQADALVLGAGEARRLGLDFTRGQLVQTQTASGRSFGYRVVLDHVTVGGIEQRGVDAIVLQGDSSRIAILGGSFLDRVVIREEGNVLLLRMAH